MKEVLLKKGGYFEAAKHEVFLAKKSKCTHKGFSEKMALKKFLQRTIKIGLTPNPETNIFNFQMPIKSFNQVVLLYVRHQ